MGQRTTSYCQAPGCDEPTKEGRRFCPRDTKRYQRKQAGRSAPPLGSPPAERLPPMERAIEAASLLIDTPAEDDQLYEERKRALEAVLREMSRKVVPMAIREGMARARAAGVRLGRPPKLQADSPIVQALMERLGVTAAAEVLGVHRSTLSRLRRDAKGSYPRPVYGGGNGAKGSISQHG